MPVGLIGQGNAHKGDGDADNMGGASVGGASVGGAPIGGPLQMNKKGVRCPALAKKASVESSSRSALLVP